MSATTTAAPDTGSSLMNTVGVWFNEGVAAIEKGAAFVYHEILSIESDITKWRTDNPMLSALADKGIEYAMSMATRFGVPVGAIEYASEDVFAALKSLAAIDPSVKSGSSNIIDTALNVAGTVQTLVDSVNKNVIPGL